MEKKKVNVISRDVLRNMTDGETINMNCNDGYEMESKKAIAYGLQKMENCKFTCRTNGLSLSITRTNN